MDKDVLEQAVKGGRLESREHSHRCVYCGAEYMCRCANPGDDDRDCGGCSVPDEDLGIYLRS